MGPATPPYDPTGVRHADTSTLRRLIYTAWAAVTPAARNRVHWVIGDNTWDLIRADPTMHTDWFGTPDRWRLLGAPVFVTGKAPGRCDLVIPLTNLTGRHT